MKIKMEFSMQAFAQALNSTVLESTYPIFSNYPSEESINPGLGQIIDMHHIFVPFHGKSVHVIEKNVEKTNDQVSDQSGSGQEETINQSDSKMDAKIKESFNHPKLIETEKIIVPKINPQKRKGALKAPEHSALKKIKHSFKFE